MCEMKSCILYTFVPHQTQIPPPLTTNSTTRLIYELLENTSYPIPDDTAQDVIDLMHDVLITSDYSRIGLSTVNPRSMRATLRHICHERELLPTSLTLPGVECIDREVVRGGSFADIIRGQYCGKSVAIKRLRMFSGSKIETKHKLYFQREALIWSMLSHDHVLPFLGTDTTLFPNTLCLILPWMDNGNVLDYFSKLQDESRDGLQTLVHQWIHQVALGLEYLHAEDTVHADLRGPNLLVDEKENIRLADFGLARLAVHQANTMTSGQPTNGQWAAPELLDPEHFGFKSARPTRESDIYSFACVCIELYTSETPFQQCNVSLFQIPLKVVQRGLRPPRPTFCVASEIMPDALWYMITQAWSAHPSHRPTATMLVSASREIL